MGLGPGVQKQVERPQEVGRASCQGGQALAERGPTPSGTLQWFAPIDTRPSWLSVPYLARLSAFLIARPRCSQAGCASLSESTVSVGLVPEGTGLVSAEVHVGRPAAGAGMDDDEDLPRLVRHGLRSR